MFQFSVWIQRQGKPEVPAQSNQAAGLRLTGRDPHTLRMLLPYSVYWFDSNVIIVVQLLSHVWFFATPWTAAHQASLSFTISQSLLNLMSIESVMPSNHLFLSPPFSPAFSLSQHRGFFLTNRLFASGGQSIGASASASASASVLPMNIQDWFPSGLTGWISSQSKGLSRVFNTTVQKHQFFGTHPSLGSNSHPYVTTRKTKALTIQTFVGKVMFLLFNMLSRFIIAFLPRSKYLLISWLPSPSAVILEPKKIKVCHCFHCFHWFKC